MFHLREDYIHLLSKQICSLLGELGSIPSGSIEIIIEMALDFLGDRYFALAVASDDSVKNLKKKIQDKIGIPPEQQTFSFRTFGNTLSDYGTE